MMLFNNLTYTWIDDDTLNILWNDRSVVRFEEYNGGLYFYCKDKGTKRYFVQVELVDLAKTVKWLIEQHGCDFGEKVNRIATSYLTDAG